MAETVPPVGVAANSLTASSCPTSYPSDYGDRLATDATTTAYDALGDKTTVTTPGTGGALGLRDHHLRLRRGGQPHLGHRPADEQQRRRGRRRDRLHLRRRQPAVDHDDRGRHGQPRRRRAIAMTLTGTRRRPSPATPTPRESPPVGPHRPMRPRPPTRPVTATTPWVSWSPRPHPPPRRRPSGQVTTYTYDPAGNQLTTEDPNGVTATSTFTPLDQVAGTSYSDSTHSVSYTYDADGNRTAMTDASGTSTLFLRPLRGADLVARTGRPRPSSYAYDALGDTTSITYPLGSGRHLGGHRHRLLRLRPGLGALLGDRLQREHLGGLEHRGRASLGTLARGERGQCRHHLRGQRRPVVDHADQRLDPPRVRLLGRALGRSGQRDRHALERALPGRLHL